MTILAKSLGRVRRILEAIDASPADNSEAQITLNPQLEQLIAAGAAPYQEITRTGTVVANTTSALAAVVALPTTATMLHVYNQAEQGGSSMIVDWVAALGIAKTAAAGQATIIANVGNTSVAVPGSLITTQRKLNGTAGTDSKTLVSTAALDAVTGVAAAWFPLGTSPFPGAAATPGHGIFCDVGGRIIVPPGRSFAMHVLADVTGSTFQGYIAWHRKQITF